MPAAYSKSQSCSSLRPEAAHACQDAVATDDTQYQRVLHNESALLMPCGEGKWIGHLRVTVCASCSEVALAHGDSIWPELQRLRRTMKTEEWQAHAPESDLAKLRPSESHREVQPASWLR